MLRQNKLEELESAPENQDERKAMVVKEKGWFVKMIHEKYLP